MAKAKTKCPACGTIFTYMPMMLKQVFDGMVTCVDLACAHRFKPAPIKQVGAGSDTRKRSNDQERRAAKRYGAKKQAGSGASWRAKGDIVDPGRLRGECKCTTAKSFTLKLSDLLKMEKEAKATEQSLFEIEFQGVHPPKRYIVLSEDQYQTLIGED